VPRGGPGVTVVGLASRASLAGGLPFLVLVFTTLTAFALGVVVRGPLATSTFDTAIAVRLETGPTLGAELGNSGGVLDLEQREGVQGLLVGSLPARRAGNALLSRVERNLA